MTSKTSGTKHSSYWQILQICPIFSCGVARDSLCYKDHAPSGVIRGILCRKCLQKCPKLWTLVAAFRSNLSFWVEPGWNLMIASEQATRVDRQTDDRREKTRFIMISAANAVAVAKAVTLGSHFGIVFFYLQLSAQVRAPHIFYSSLSTSSGTILEIGNLSVGHPFCCSSLHWCAHAPHKFWCPHGIRQSI